MHGDPVGHQRLAGLRHDDAAGGVAGGAQPDPCGRGRRVERTRAERLGRRSRPDQGAYGPSGPREDKGQPAAVRPRLRRRFPRNHNDAITNAKTSITPATRNASGPVTKRPANRETTAPSYRPVMMSSVKTSV